MLSNFQNKSYDFLISVTSPFSRKFNRIPKTVSASFLNSNHSLHGWSPQRPVTLPASKPCSQSVTPTARSRQRFGWCVTSATASDVLRSSTDSLQHDARQLDVNIKLLGSSSSSSKMKKRHNQLSTPPPPAALMTHNIHCVQKTNPAP